MKCGQKRKQKLASKYKDCIFAARYKNAEKFLTKRIEIHSKSYKKI